jgi:hypothetical protein
LYNQKEFPVIGKAFNESLDSKKGGEFHFSKGFYYMELSDSKITTWWGDLNTWLKG